MDSGEAFDRARWAELFGEDREGLLEFLRFAMDSTRQTVEKLAYAVASRDAASASRLAHNLKGASANIGALAISLLGERAEAAAKVPEWPALEALLDPIRDALQAAEREVSVL